jgi:hypothetical protein
MENKNSRIPVIVVEVMGKRLSMNSRRAIKFETVLEARLIITNKTATMNDLDVLFIPICCCCSHNEILYSNITRFFRG